MWIKKLLSVNIINSNVDRGAYPLNVDNLPFFFSPFLRNADKNTKK